MDYQQAIDYLYSFPDSEAKLPRSPAEFNLPQTEALLAAFGDPRPNLRCVVVAGTKGKGSTCVLLEAIARASGLRTGLWTSPHLHSYRERIQVDRQPISQADFIRLIEMIPGRLTGFDREQYGDPTIFQLGFALALRYFADRAVDLAILEVGLGGRYDSANVVTPLVSVISSISYDHMAILGDTLGKIAYEKAGILKGGVPAVTVPQHPEAMEVIERVAREVGAPLYLAEGSGVKGQGPESRSFGYPISTPQSLIPQQLGGTFQRENARLAAGAAMLLRTAGLPIVDAAIAEGIATARWPGRMEIVEGQPPIVLDGAHNGDSAHKLVESLQEAFPGRRLVLVLGVSQGHNAEHIMQELVPAASTVILTHSRHPRAMTDLHALAALAEPFLAHGADRIPVAFAADARAAITHARALSGPDDVICITGSLFVVGEAREALGIADEVD